MLNRLIFREYDIRGVYPTEINEESTYVIGRSYGSYLREKYNINSCVVGYDNRLSSEGLTEKLIKGITESGVNVLNYGLVTTPMHYFSRKTNKLPGIMVTASHNPKEDNGLKFSFDYEVNARGDMIKDFTDYTFNGDFLNGNGVVEDKSITDQYLKFMSDNIYMGEGKIRVAFDPGNGTTSTILSNVINLFDNIIPIYINNESDGTFPNHHPDPCVEDNLKQLKEIVKKEKCDLGIAFDGDGDRLGLVDQNGDYIATDKYMIMIIRDIIDKAKSKKFLYDVKCSKALEDEILKLGGEPFCYRTGASFTEYGVLSNNLDFGGEFSGHIFFNDRGLEIGSGIYAGLRLIEILSNCELKVSDLIKGINNYYATPEIKVKTTDIKKFDIVNKVKEYCLDKKYHINDIDGVRVTFDNGWALVRASNTGPNLTLRFEATNEVSLKKISDEFTNLVNLYNE